MKYYFRLRFWIYDRYTNSFEFEEEPPLEEQEDMIKLFLACKGWKELQEKYWLKEFKMMKKES